MDLRLKESSTLQIHNNPTKWRALPPIMGQLHNDLAVRPLTSSAPSRSAELIENCYVHPWMLAAFFFLARRVACFQFAKNQSSPLTAIKVRGGGRPSAPSTPSTLKPLWSGGVHQDDIDALVDACLKDPTINIKAIPDWLERQIYHSTITLVLTTLHKGLSSVHGKTLWGHEFEITRLPRRKDRMETAIADLSELSTSPEHAKVLEQVADRLLANKHINQPLIPDVLERQLYTNCLKIVFRVLDLLAASFRLTLCGHDLKLQLDPCDDWTKVSYQEAALKRLAEKNSTATGGSSCLNDMSLERMKQAAKEIGMARQDHRPTWRRWLTPANNEFIAQLHASAYCLVLGIVDDFLEHTEIQLLSDRFEFNLAPMSDASATTTPEVSSAAGTEAKMAGATKFPSSILAAKHASTNGLAYLVVGVAIGYALHAVLVQHSQFRLGAILSHLKSTIRTVSENARNGLRSVVDLVLSIFGNSRGSGDSS